MEDMEVNLKSIMLVLMVISGLMVYTLTWIYAPMFGVIMLHAVIFIFSLLFYNIDNL